MWTVDGGVWNVEFETRDKFNMRIRKRGVRMGQESVDDISFL